MLRRLRRCRHWMPERRVVPCLCDASLRQRVIKDSNRQLEAKLGSKAIRGADIGFILAGETSDRGVPL